VELRYKLFVVYFLSFILIDINEVRYY